MTYTATHARDRAETYPRDREWSALQSRIRYLAGTLRDIRESGDITDAPQAVRDDLAWLAAEAGQFTQAAA